LTKRWLEIWSSVPLRVGDTAVFRLTRNPVVWSENDVSHHYDRVEFGVARTSIFVIDVLTRRKTWLIDANDSDRTFCTRQDAFENSWRKARELNGSKPSSTFHTRSSLRIRKVVFHRSCSGTHVEITFSNRSTYNRKNNTTKIKTTSTFQNQTRKRENTTQIEILTISTCTGSVVPFFTIRKELVRTDFTCTLTTERPSSSLQRFVASADRFH
jgi:hypothetical protein